MSNEPTSTLLAAWANAFKSTNRLLKLKLGSPSKHLTSKLLVASFTAKETLSTCPEYVITLLSDDAHIELKSLLGVPATLQLLTDQSTQSTGSIWQDSQTQYRTFNGIIYNVQQLGSNGGFAKYQITVVPAFKLLSLRRNNRVIQDKTVPDIINLILKEHQPGNPLLQWQLNLSDTHPPRSYCVQYRESDLAFLERLMREEGMYYYITHPDNGEPGQHTLTITDDHYSLNTNPAQSIRFHRSDATESSDSITQWQARRTLKSGHVALASFDYKTVQTIVSGEPTNQHQGDAANPLSAHLEHYDPQTAYYGTQQADLDRYTRLRIEAMEAAAKTFNGKGTVRSLIPGTWFEL